jgi:shikimate kinase
MKPICLVGMPGSGKTALGQALAQALDLPLIDLDERIEATAGMNVSDIFSEKGEFFFRNLEHELLLESVKTTNTILATGGGTPCFFDNMGFIKAHCSSLFIDLDISILAERLYPHKHTRPLFREITDREVFEGMLNLMFADRGQYYKRADFSISVTDPAESAAEIADRCIPFFRA